MLDPTSTNNTVKPKTMAAKATKTASAKAPNTTQKKAIEQRLRRLGKELEKHEAAANRIEKKMDELAAKHAVFAVGDEVTYNGPEPSRAMTGIVVEVEFARGWANYPERKFPFPIVKVGPFLKGRGRKLSRSWASLRHFTMPHLLTLVAKKGSVAPFTR